MDKEKKEREEAEKEKAERLEKISSQFDDAASQWEKDKSDIRDMSRGDVNDGKSHLLKEGKDGKAHIVDPLEEIPVLGGKRKRPGRGPENGDTL
ncbi:hypothetical protein BT93_L1350 [Corymbia citriodora subsp. variegata]|uniref:Uncharacterized protein n=1 Tax=Corymbia citriodora subsp. variegata TaxID=360336 RepID=A0A8T0CHU9_CORYI|nr:hypothetical protein BT93_L1350 [Corymbia citriodora subsp. variegata]